MGKVRLLDCTLRDGGYVNDWKFGHDNLVSIYERVVDSGIELIEVGFLDDRRPFDINRSIMPDTKSVEKIWGNCKKKAPIVLGMIDYGTCKLENIQPCEESYLDGIRVIFKKHLMHEAMAYCAEIKKLGYKVFSQLVSITSYSDEDLMELIDIVNEVKPYAVSMVDTYGLLHPEDLLHYYEILDEHVDQEIQIGFHAHNNFQMAYANALVFVQKPTGRDIVVDGTVYGMGKSAGNAPIELLAMRLNEKYGKNYAISPMLESIRESVVDFHAVSPWGYSLFFYLAAENKCHPSYVTFFQSKGNLSISKVNELLGRIQPEEKKLLYDKGVAEKLYDDYVKNECDDTEIFVALGKELSKKNILLIGPGKNIVLQREKVEQFIENENPYIISINYIPERIDVDCVFVTNEKRYRQMSVDLQRNVAIKTLATSNVESTGKAFEYVVNRAPLLETKEEYSDNSFLMLLKVLQKAGVKKVVCAGLDGYSEREDNYFNPNMEYNFVKDAARHFNKHMREVVEETRKGMDVEFLTYSKYDESEARHEAAF